MKGDMKRKEIIKEIKEYCENFLEYVYSFKCQCAYTDRAIDKIIELSEKLKELK